MTDLFTFAVAARAERAHGLRKRRLLPSKRKDILFGRCNRFHHDVDSGSLEQQNRFLIQFFKTFNIYI